jgi:hypothetical protein
MPLAPTVMPPLACKAKHPERIRGARVMSERSEQINELVAVCEHSEETR